MTDLEMTKLCAEAAELYVEDSAGLGGLTVGERKADGLFYPKEHYGPLHNDAQALALVKSETLDVTWGPGEQRWRVGQFRFGTEKGMTGKDGLFCEVRDTNLNRAIVECVAALHTAATSNKATV